MVSDSRVTRDYKTAELYWEEAGFTDNLIFRMVMEKESLVKKLLEVLLDITIAFLEVREHERSFEEGNRSKGIRLDIYVRDSNGVIYDIEMQTGVYRAEYFGKRTRYYQSILDYELLKKNEPYTNLKRTIIIFICTFDPFDRGLGRYTFRSTCQEDKSLNLRDESDKIFFNASGSRTNLTDQQRAFLDYVAGKGATDDFTKEIEAEVEYVKSDSRKKVDYMTWAQEMLDYKYFARMEGREEGRMEGLEEGRKEANNDTAVRMLKRGKMSVQEIAEDCGISEEQVRKIAQENEISIAV